MTRIRNIKFPSTTNEATAGLTLLQLFQDSGHLAILVLFLDLPDSPGKVLLRTRNAGGDVIEDVGANTGWTGPELVVEAEMVEKD